MTLDSPSLFWSFRQKCFTAGGICISFACFFLPLSTSLVAAFTSFTILFWFISGTFLRLPEIFKTFPVSLLALLFFAFMIIAVFYSPASTDDAVYTLKKYRELLLFPVIISMLASSRKYRELAENSFLTGCIVLMAISYGMACDIIPEDRYGHSIVFHITHNFFMAVLSFWSLHLVFQSKTYRYFWTFIFLAASGNLFYVAPGRTGMFVYVCLILLFFIQKLSLKKMVGGILLLCCVLLAFYHTSYNFHCRVFQVIHEIKKYEPQKSRSSVGQRFDWWLSSIDLIKQKPLLGHGTGSYSYVQKVVTENTGIKETNNPHNEYLFLGVQFGIIGIFFFLGIFLLIYIRSKELPHNKQMFLNGVIVAMLSGCLINSFLFDSLQGHFFLLLSSALLTAESKKSAL